MGGDKQPQLAIKLTGDLYTSYQQWRSFCINHFQSSKLRGFIDGTYACPPQGPKDPSFGKWYKGDQEVLQWMKSTLSEHLNNQMMVMGSDSSRKLWLNLEKYFHNALLHNPVPQLKSRLQEEQKDATMTLGEHLALTRKPADELAKAGAPLKDHDQGHVHTPKGPPAEDKPHVSSSDLEMMSVDDEEEKQQQQQAPPPPVASAVDVPPDHPREEIVDMDSSHDHASPPPKSGDDVEYAIGIDLGTTYSRVAVWQTDHIEIILNDHGNRKTASCVGFTETEETLVGDAAFKRVIRNTRNSVFETKRLIGRKFSDPSVQSDVRLWPFAVIGGPADKPKISVSCNGQEKQFEVQEISAMILRKMKETAETYLGKTVTNAVITVPAYFNDSQRQATIEAGVLADLNVLGIINEPSAAAIAYGLHKKADWSTRPRKVMIFDLGGGTLDVSLLIMSNSGDIQVKATAGDTHLGGEDFDNTMVNYCVEEFRREHNLDVETDFRALRRLKKECEKAKKRLSFELDFFIEIDCLCENTDFAITFTRHKFEELNMGLFQKCMEPVKKCLKYAKMGIRDVDDVLLAGGSSRIPMVQQLLKAVFEGKELCKGINPDEAVVYGAAAHAAAKSGNGKGKFIEDYTLKDVNPLPLGVQGIDIDGSTRRMDLIERNRTLPLHRQFELFTIEDNQILIQFCPYEGEESVPENVNLLGTYSILEIPPAPKHERRFDMFYEIDTNGILSVFAKDRSTGEKKTMAIDSSSGLLFSF